MDKQSCNLRGRQFQSRLFSGPFILLKIMKCLAACEVEIRTYSVLVFGLLLVFVSSHMGCTYDHWSDLRNPVSPDDCIVPLLSIFLSFFLMTVWCCCCLECK